MMSELIKQLRLSNPKGTFGKDMHEAANALEAKDKRIAELEAVAKEAAKWLNNDPKRTYSALGEALSKLEEKDNE
jgi:hypothetical protein